MRRVFSSRKSRALIQTSVADSAQNSPLDTDTESFPLDPPVEGTIFVDRFRAGHRPASSDIRLLNTGATINSASFRTALTPEHGHSAVEFMESKRLTEDVSGEPV